MKDPLIEKIENDPMFRRMFLDYGDSMPFFSKLIFKIRVALRF